MPYKMLTKPVTSVNVLGNGSANRKRDGRIATPPDRLELREPAPTRLAVAVLQALVWTPLGCGPRDPTPFDRLNLGPRHSAQGHPHVRESFANFGWGLLALARCQDVCLCAKIGSLVTTSCSS